MGEPGDLLLQVVNQYRALHGEPGYRYFKKRVSWQKFRRQPGYHSAPIGSGEEVTEEEYAANVAQSERLVVEAFMGRWSQSYWRYDRKMVKDGWCEALVKDVQAHATPPTPITSPEGVGK